MSVQANNAPDQVNLQLIQAAQAMLTAIREMSTAPGIDFSLPVYAPVAKAHADLHDATAEAATAHVIAKSRG